MKFITLLSVLLCVSVLGVKAQTAQYEAGFIIQNQDTLSGYLEITDDIQLSHSVSYKENLLTETPIVYSPRELKGFGFVSNNQNYSSIEVNLSESTKPNLETRFAKILVLGEVTLYKLELSAREKEPIFLKNNFHLFIANKEGRFYTLGQYEYAIENRVRHDKRYIGLLKALLNDCLESSKEITDELEFTDEPIIQLIQKYNSCKNPIVAQSLHSDRIKPIIKHGITTSLTKIYTNLNVVDDLGFSIGYYWDRERPERSRKLVESIGINYLYLRYAHVYYKQTSLVKPSERIEVPDALHFIRIPVQIQLKFNNRAESKLIPFLLGGVTGQFATDNALTNADIIPFINVGAGVYVKRLKIFTTVENIGFSLRSDKLFNLGLGIRLDRVQSTILP